MSVVCEAYNVIVRRSTVETKYPGGFARYEADSPNMTFAADAFLTRIAFLSMDDVQIFAKQLFNHAALSAQNHDGSFNELAVVKEGFGAIAECDWLEHRTEDGVMRTWLSGVPEGEMATPAGWEPMRLIHTYEDAEGIHVQVPEGVEHEPGQTLYGARSFLEDGSTRERQV